MGVVRIENTESDADDMPLARAAALAERLHEHGVPERRAEVAALADAGLSLSEIAATLDIARPNVSTHKRRYRGERAEAEWLVENGPDI